MFNSKERGFTLIELLVVIAIIAILAAVLFPVFAQAKEASKKVVCLSNLKNVAMASFLYQGDYDDTMMLSGYTINPGNSFYTWFAGKSPNVSPNPWKPEVGHLYPYLKNGNIIDCPTAQDLPVGVSNPFALGWNTRGISTSSNNINMSLVDLPAETIALADSAGISSFTTLSRAATLAVTAPGNIHGRHAGLAVVGWMDGHAKANRITYNDRYTNGVRDAAWCKKNNLGTITPRPLQYVGTTHDYTERDIYYYSLAKPAL